MPGSNAFPTRSDFTEEAAWARLNPAHGLSDNDIMVVYVRDEFEDSEELTRAIKALPDFRGKELRLVGFRTVLGYDRLQTQRALAGLKKYRWIMPVMTPLFSGTPDTRYFLEYMAEVGYDERWVPVTVCKPRQPLAVRRIADMRPYL